MFPILYKKDETNFVHNGLGVLSGAISSVPEEELNGLFEIKIEYDSEGFLADQIENGMIVKAKANDKQDPQLFRIYAIEKDMGSDVYIIHGQHITYDLAGNFVEELILEKATTKEAMEGIQANLTYPTRFNITSSNNTTTSSTRLYRTNPLQMIGGMEGSILQFWGGQIERDNFNLIMHKRRGSDDGVLVTYKKNLTGLEAKFDESNVVTRIFPFKYIEATEDEPEQLITIDGKFIDSLNIDKYPVIKILPLDLSDDESIKNKTDLYNASKDFFNEGGKDLPTVEMEVEFESLYGTEEYRNVAPLELVGMGDTITVRHSKMGIDVQAQVVNIEYDSIAEKNKRVSIGNVKARLTDTVNNASNIANTIDEKIQGANQKANEAIKAANGKNTIYYGTEEPTGDHLIEGDLWFRVVDGEYTRTYRYDGVQWQLVVSADIRDIEEEAEEARRAAENAVANANLATGNALEAIEQAQGAFDQATDAHTIADAANDLADVTNKLALTIKETVDGHAVQIKENETEISRKMSTVDANAKFATQSQLTQTSSSLTSEIAKVQGNLDGLSLGWNVIPNSKGDNLEGWTVWSSTELRIVDGVIRVRKGLSSTAYGAITQVFNVVAGQEYTLSLDVASNFRTTKLDYMYLMYDDGLGNQGLPNINMSNAHTELRRYSIKFTADKDGTVNLLIGSRVVEDSYEYEGFLLSKVQLEEGNMSNPWAPAFADLATVVELSKVEQTVESISTQVTKKVDKTTYDSFVQQTSQSLSSKISIIDADNKYATQSSLAQTAEGLQAKVENKADKSTVTQLAGVVDSKISTNDADAKFATQSQLTQTSSSLQSTISSVRNDLNNLDVAERNLIKNSKGDSLVGWSNWGVTTTLVTNYLEHDWIWVTRSNANSQVGIHTPVFNLKANVTYICSFLIRSRSNSGYDLNYIYLRQGTSSLTSIKRLPDVNMRDSKFVGDIASDGLRVWFTFSHTEDVPNARLLLAIDGRPENAGFIIRETKIAEGNTGKSWIPAPEDLGTQSQISQLSTDINLRVKKGDTITQINIDGQNSGVLIQGRNLLLDGDTTVNGTFKVNNANIVSVDAGKMTTGTLDAGKVSVVNLNASNINSGELNTGKIKVRGGTTTDYSLIEGSFMELRGRFQRTWQGSTTTHDVKTRLQNGHLRFRNDNLNRSLYMSEFGISTYVDGEGELGGSSGTLMWWDKTYSPSNANGITMHSHGGVAALASNTSHVVLDSYRSVDIYSRDSVVYVSPKTDVYSGNNNFWFNLIDGTSDGFLMFGSKETVPGVGLRFSKSSSSNTISIVDSNYTRGGNTTFDVGNLKVNSITKRESDTGVYWNGSSGGNTGVGAKADVLWASGIRALEGTSDIFLATHDGSVRVTDHRGFNNGDINYRPIGASNFAQLSTRKNKTNIEALGDVGLNVINSLVVSEYDLINDLNAGKQVGLIAEDSTIVAMENNTAINLYKLTSYNTKAIQELDTNLNSSKEELVLKIAKLEERLNKLEVA